jgi:hypothetical protein
MKAIHIPADPAEPITLREVGDLSTWQGMDSLFPGSITERVRFGRADERNRVVPFTDGDAMVVMLVDENGLIYNLPPNPRATTLYRSGVHDGLIVGDAYLVLQRVSDDDEFWSEPQGAHAEPDFWAEVCDG